MFSLNINDKKKKLGHQERSSIFDGPYLTTYDILRSN
jgi:hypothetical protein